MLDIGTEKLESNCDCSCVGQLGLSAHIGRKRHVHVRPFAELTASFPAVKNFAAD
jgi:hypothetical protein